MKKLLLTTIAALVFCAAASAQKGSPLVSNPGNNIGKTQVESYRKKPLYKPPVLNDVQFGFPNRLMLKPLTQQQYDFQKRVHFGFVLAVSALDYQTTTSTASTYSTHAPTVPHNFFVDVTNLSPALGVAALMDYRLSHNLSLRLQIGPTFGTRALNFYEADTLTLSMQLESVLLEMPMLVKYKATRHSDFRPYMIAGLTPYCDVSSFKSFNEKRNLLIALNPLDLAGTVGFGFDAYFDFFKFAVELKYAAGFFNAASSKSLEGYEQYPSAIKNMRSRTFVLSLIFE